MKIDEEAVKGNPVGVVVLPVAEIRGEVLRISRAESLPASASMIFCEQGD